MPRKIKKPSASKKHYAEPVAEDSYHDREKEAPDHEETQVQEEEDVVLKPEPNPESRPPSFPPPETRPQSLPPPEQTPTSPLPVLQPGEKYFEAPDGTLLVGEADKQQLWYRKLNDGKGGWINPKR
jgi:hypothetical protein